jgi:hypothetical protein
MPFIKENKKTNKHKKNKYMLPLILVAVGAYLIGDSVLGDKKYDKGGVSDGGEKAAQKRLEELRKELRAERISYGELAELESLKEYIDDDDIELRQAAGIPEFEDEDDDDDKYAKGGMTDADKAMKEGYVQQVVEIATKANENGIKASDLTYEEFSDKVFEATSTSYGKDYLRGAYEIMTKKGYAEGGMMDEVNTEVIAVKGNIMGTTTLDLKIKGMRKPQDFIVYPISTEEAGKPITIQSDTRFGYLDLSSGRGLMSQSHANGAYSYHFAADKKVPFKISETDVKKIKEHLASKASSKAGNSVIFSENSGADKMAKGGKLVGKQKNLDVNKNGKLDAEDFKMLRGEKMAKGGEVADIAKVKKSLISKAKSKGLYENFGQKERRQLEDKYGNTPAIRDFDNWVSNFDLSQL